MIRKFASAAFAFVWLIVCGWVAPAFTVRGQAKPVVFATTPRPISAELQLSDGSSVAVRGRASLTVTAANEDDTLTGTLVYTLPDDARQKIARTANKNLKDVPSNITLKDVSAKFRHGTACPSMTLEVSVKETGIQVTGGAIEGTKLRFDRVVLNIHEAPDQMTQLLCNWTRQINAKRQRRGIIAAINRLLQPEEQADAPK
jgi:hypothetical protein